jgi:hypothetical protein
MVIMSVCQCVHPFLGLSLGQAFRTHRQMVLTLCVSIVPLEINVLVPLYFLTSNHHSQRDGCVNLGNRISTG